MSEPLDAGSLIVTVVETPRREIQVLRKQTKQFINQHPLEVILVRQELMSDGAGGVTHSIIPQEPQIVRLITQLSPGMASLSRMTEDGIETRPDYVLLGEWDANMRTHDYFMKDGIKYELVYVREDRRYETWAEVAYRG